MIIGIDISKAKFDACITSSNGKKRYNIFSNNTDGYKKLLNGIGTTTEDIHFCMEATGCYHLQLAEYLHDNGCKVSVVNPLQVKRYKESVLIRQKTDKSDAYVISEFCRVNNPPLFVPKTKEIKELDDLNKYINNLKQELLRWKNRLEKEHYNKYVIKGIDEKIKNLEEEIKRLEGEIVDYIKNSEELSNKYENITSIKGVGPKLATTILSEIPDVNCFKNADQYAAYVGVTPSHFLSGSSVKGKSHISRKGNKNARKPLYMAAMVTKNHNEYFQKWIKTLEKKGKPPKVIIVAVMRKLLTIVYGILKYNTKFNPDLAFAESC
jgi:transposase